MKIVAVFSLLTVTACSTTNREYPQVESSAPSDISSANAADGDIPFACRISAKEFDGPTVIIVDKVVINAAEAEEFDRSAEFQSPAGEVHTLRFYFKAHIKKNPTTGMNQSLSKTLVQNPFDNTVLRHDDASGETELSPSIMNLIDNLVGNRQAFFSYNLNIIRNPRSDLVLLYAGKRISEIYANCQSPLCQTG